jgi:hypothetical protein
MADDTFGADARQAPTVDDGAGERRPYGTIVIVGGGCYGSYYARQLARASAAGAIRWSRLVVVDRDPECAVARHLNYNATDIAGMADRVDVVCTEWREFFESYLDAASTAPATVADDAIVPSPLMPHLLFDWLLARARSRWPDRQVGTRMLGHAPDVPWQRQHPAGTTRWVSFAEWMCPVNCVEPRLCPVTRGPRTWSMPPALHQYVLEARSSGDALAGPVVFHCAHRAYGVGMIDTRAVVAGDEFVREAGTGEAVNVLVGTVSHCHGAWDVLAVGART